jgi:hypothetical protein
MATIQSSVFLDKQKLRHAGAVKTLIIPRKISLTYQKEFRGQYIYP